jgi:arylsulfatase B
MQFFAAALLDPPQDYRNALVIVADDIGADALTLTGGVLNIPTPNLDALAQAGVLFSNAYANPRCDPTRRVLQTGHWWTGSNGPGCQVTAGPQTPVLSEDFIAERAPGHAFALFGKSHLGVHPTGGDPRKALIAHGYEAVVCGLTRQVAYCNGTGYGNDLSRQGGQPNTVWPRFDASPGGASSGLVGDYQPDVLLSSFLTSYPSAPPENVTFYCFQLAHEPTHPPEGYSPFLPPALRYPAMVAYMDAQLGQILAEVDFTTTLVIFLGDNGTLPEAAPDPNRAKGTTFEGGIRIPMVMAGGPTVNGGRTSDEFVHAVDVYETVLDWVGSTVPPSGAWPIASRTLVPILDETTYAPRDYIVAGNHWKEVGANEHGDRCILTADGWKLRQEDDDHDGVPEREDLFLLPDETTDLLAVHPTIAATLRGILVAQSLP